MFKQLNNVHINKFTADVIISVHCDNCINHFHINTIGKPGPKLEMPQITLHLI